MKQGSRIKSQSTSVCNDLVSDASGGINVDADQVSSGGDIIGRDNNSKQIETVTYYIENATFIMPMSAPPPDSAERRLFCDDPTIAVLGASPPASTFKLTGDIELAQNGRYSFQVSGDSMVDAGIKDGYTVLVERRSRSEWSTIKNGEIVVAWLKKRDEMTVKYYFLDRESGIVTFRPANPDFDPIVIPFDDVEIQGVVVDIVPPLPH